MKPWHSRQQEGPNFQGEETPCQGKQFMAGCNSHETPARHHKNPTPNGKRHPNPGPDINQFAPAMRPGKFFRLRSTSVHMLASPPVCFVKQVLFSWNNNLYYRDTGATYHHLTVSGLQQEYWPVISEKPGLQLIRYIFVDHACYYDIFDVRCSSKLFAIVSAIPVYFNLIYIHTHFWLVVGLVEAS